MNEAETRAELIDPKLQAAGWGVIEGSKVLREFHITAGKILLGGTKGKPLIADYVLVRRSQSSRDYYRGRGLEFYNPLGLGLEVETGGHVFAATFTNSTALLENQFIPETRSSWAKGEFRWGFTIARRFALGHGKKV